jgi:hypothetical protein
MVISSALVATDKDDTAITAKLPRTVRRVIGMAAFVMGAISTLGLNMISQQGYEAFSYHS